VTVTDDDSVARGSGLGPPGRLTGRQLREQLADDTWLDELIDRAEQGGVQLTGEGGFLPELVKAVLERGLDAELTDHLGYERGDPAGRGSPNSRNGTTPKTVQSQIGAMGLDVPRDRDSSFEPRLVPKGERRLAGLDDMIISLYAGGMTIRDIQHHLARTIGTELSHETISKITDAVAEEVKAWQARPLEPIYPIVYVDALVVKVRDGHQVRNRAAHIAVGVDLDGISTCSESGCRPPRGRSSGPGWSPSWPTAGFGTSSSPAATGSPACPRRSRPRSRTPPCRPAWCT
jgi:putative transposase